MVKIKSEHSQEEKIVCFMKKYKLVALKVKPVFSTLSSRFKIIRNIQGNPLDGIPELLELPSKFMPKKWYSLKKKEKNK